MALYEHVYLARQDVSQQQVDALTEEYSNLIAEHGGKVEGTEYWGMKGLSFRIKKNRKAHYTMMNIDAPAAAVQEMERQMGISEDVIRFMTIKVDEFVEGPSAMMQKRDDRRGGRPDRGDRPDRGERRPRREEETPASEGAS
ncbi:MAG: 30S ribosomal protein S6 [Pseudomonadota bacterium]